MTTYFSLAQLSDILRVQPIFSEQPNILTTLVVGITTDTRTVKTGEIFVALVGDNFDGHNFVDTAVEKGAIALIVDREVEIKTRSSVRRFRYFRGLSKNCSVVAQSIRYTHRRHYWICRQNQH